MKLPLYFISDIHLKLTIDQAENDRRKKLYRLLDKICETGGTCFFVGDLFDFYFEYPDVIPKAYADFYEKASYMKKNGVDLHFQTGNHDHWFQDFLEKEIMNKVYIDDIRRLKIARKALGDKTKIMIDANQVWEVDEAIKWIKKLEFSNPFFIEEPTSPDDVSGHKKIRQAVKPIKVATGEMCVG